MKIAQFPKEFEKHAYLNTILMNSKHKTVYGEAIILKGIAFRVQYYGVLQENTLYLNRIQRLFLKVALTDICDPVQYDQERSIVCNLVLLDVTGTVDTQVSIDYIKTQLLNHFVTTGQTFNIERFSTIKIVNTIENELVSETTKIIFVDDKYISRPDTYDVLKTELDPKSLGIGGLDKELFDMFRKVFSIRQIPSKIRKELGVKNVKGVLLYGPPGTGKTLIARKIGEGILNCPKDNIKVVNAAEVLDKYVGESEKNTRDLFQKAIDDQKREKKDIHIFIFDEFDAIASKRGTSENSQIGNRIVNTLLTLIDGVNSLDNILVIGITNRKDMIDPALLRSGRLEVHIEVGLPNTQGRGDILEIHTKTMRESGRCILSSEEIQFIAERTPNYSGAELEGLVKMASSLAISRDLKLRDNTDINPIITIKDFNDALLDFKPAFGRKDEIYRQILLNEVKPYKFSTKRVNDYVRCLLNPEKVPKETSIDQRDKIKEYLSAINDTFDFRNKNVRFATDIEDTSICGSLITYICHLTEKSAFNQTNFVSPMKPSFSSKELIYEIEMCKMAKYGNSCIILDDIDSMENTDSRCSQIIHNLIRSNNLLENKITLFLHGGIESREVETYYIITQEFIDMLNTHIENIERKIKNDY